MEYFPEGSSIIRKFQPLTRGTTHTFGLNNFTFLTFNIFPNRSQMVIVQLLLTARPVVYYNEGLSTKQVIQQQILKQDYLHKVKIPGVLTFDVPALAPTTLYYATGDGSVYGTITTQDPNCYRYWIFHKFNSN